MVTESKPEIWFVIFVKAADWALDMAQNMARGFEAGGYNILLLLLDDSPGRFQQIVNEISKKVDSREPFVIIDLNMTFNFEGFPPDLVPWRYSWVGDNPVHHYMKHANVLTNSLVGVPDQRYFKVYEALGIDENLVFAPHAGPDPIDNPLPMVDRDIDLMFAGNFKLLPDTDEWAARKADFDSLAAAAIDDATEKILEEDLESFQALVSAFEARGMDWREMDFKDVWEAHRVAESFAEGIRRCEVLSKIEHLGLHIVGEVSDEVRNRLPKTTFHKFPGFPKMLEMVERTKILINVTPKLAGGSHDRICNGMARGSVLATTYSSYLAEQFEDGKDIIYFPKKLDGFELKLADLIADCPRLDAMAASSRTIYTERHTWRKRAIELGEAMTAAVSAKASGGT